MSAIISTTKVKKLPLSVDVVTNVAVSELSNQMMSHVNISFLSTENAIVLSSGQHVTSVDCSQISNNNYLDKHAGGAVSGDVDVVQHNINILSGNYIQTSTSDAVVNYASKNAFLQADVDSNYGNSYAGTKAFCVLQVISANNQIRLSGDISELKDIVDGHKTVGDYGIDISKSRSLRRVFGLDVGSNNISLSSSINISAAAFSMTIDSYSTSMGFHLSSVDTSTGIVTLAESLGDFNSYNGNDEQWFIDAFKDDDNAFYLVGFPEIGNLNVETNFGQHAQGGSVRAIGRETHAEGRDNVADIRYAHVEGSHNIAGDMSTHAEGFRTYAAGRYSHSEGESTEAIGRMSHAEGKLTQANGSCSHVEGEECKTVPNYGNESECGYGHAEGYKSTAGYVAHAECWQTSALGNGSHAEGHLTLAYGKHSHAEGENTIAMASSAHAEGYATSALYFTAHSEGYMSYAGQVGAHAEGGYYLANNNYIQGGTCRGASHGSHAEGLSTFVDGGIGAHAEGCGCIATGNGAHAEGGYWASNKVWEGTLASGKGSHSEGCATMAFGKGAHASGLSSVAGDDASFAHGRNAQATGNSAIAFGYNSTAGKKLSYVNGENCYAISGDYAFATGYHCNAEGMASRADGYYSQAKKKWDIALGVNATAQDEYTYVWSGIERGSNYTNNYASHGQGSFNVNPKNGISSFYIGQDNFIQCVLSAIVSMNDDQKTALKNALDIG